MSTMRNRKIEPFFHFGTEFRFSALESRKVDAVLTATKDVEGNTRDKILRTHQNFGENIPLEPVSPAYRL